MHEPRFLLFASDATLVGIVGLALLLIAAGALVADRRRLRRRQIDAVGWVPWTPVFLVTAFAGVTLMALAVKGWLGG